MKKTETEEFFDIAREHSELVSFYKQCFSSPAGEQVLKDLESAYGNRLSYSKDPYDTAFKEGQRSLLLRIKSMITERKE
jgi:hypothetical protein